MVRRPSEFKKIHFKRFLISPAKYDHNEYFLFISTRTKCNQGPFGQQNLNIKLSDVIGCVHIDENETLFRSRLTYFEVITRTQI